ncbi:uncharacterized protein N7477_003578 [Penicillium maclennaniae]|uniref:uncharacterized protein n=1 Tax=Penicillium maclennaniae TaxID=1343394 RepID=UPI002541E70D|nr:uncharacterized protein N7477_003578 [Penicillium maclennaniae]KAJ5677945.1 hypothetical protein N7477_003578 [Penicillium maclennaniae]
MEKLRKQARDALLRDPGNLPSYLPAAGAAAKKDLYHLWQNVSAHDSSTHLNICESLLTAIEFLSAWDQLLPNDGGPKPLEGNEVEAVSNLFRWASSLALPTPAFAVNYGDNAEITDELKTAQEESRRRSELAITLILSLNKPLPGLRDRSVASSPDVILAVASFTSREDPWTTEDSFMEADMHLSTKNPAITSEGRKNLHPVPPTRFDGSSLDDSTRPWKNTDIYAASVLSWIISQYEPTGKAELEAHFPLLVPAILAMIDDSSIHFKTTGLKLFAQILKPIQESGSDILLRTNLASVFRDAITPCLLSLPSITPEESSLRILGAAYPALLALFKTAYKASRKQLQSKEDEYTTSLSTILRSNLISSFHHISSSSPISVATSASFPHPRLSTFLLNWICIFVQELGIHTIKYLQEIVPLLYPTLTNPFGAARPELLLSSVSATKAVVLNAHPRIWKWRGEILAGLTACWLHVGTETRVMTSPVPINELSKLKRELQATVYLLKHALQNPVVIEGVQDADQLAAKDNMDRELNELVVADAELKDLLLADAKA